MLKTVQYIGSYHIAKCGNEYIIINKKGEYKHHAHLKDLRTCFIIIDLVRRKRIPKSTYLMETARRLTTDRVYELELIKAKREANKYGRRKRKHSYNGRNKKSHI